MDKSGAIHADQTSLLTDKRNATSKFKVMLYKCLYMRQ